MKQCIIVGGGASIKEGIENGLWDKIKKNDIWSLNYAFMTMPYLPQREIWVDKEFFKNHIEEIEYLYKQGVKCYTRIHTIYMNIPEIITYDTTRSLEEANSKFYIGNMGLTGFFALHIAVQEQYDIIYLLGYDFGTINPMDKFTHYYQDKLHTESVGVGHPEYYRDASQKNILNDVKDFEIFLSPKFKIYNVSPQSNIECFEKINFSTFFNKIKPSMDSEPDYIGLTF